MRQLVTGFIPWSAAGSMHTGPLGMLEQRMGLVALELRAAQQEQQLIEYEMMCLMQSLEEDIAAAVAAKTNAQEQQQRQLQHYEELSQRRSLTQAEHCELHTAYRQMQLASGRQLLISQRIAVLQRLRETAVMLLQPVMTPHQGQQRSLNNSLTTDQLVLVADDLMQQPMPEEGSHGQVSDGEEGDFWSAAECSESAEVPDARSSASPEPSMQVHAAGSRDRPAVAGMPASWLIGAEVGVALVVGVVCMPLCIRQYCVGLNTDVLTVPIS